MTERHLNADAVASNVWGFAYLARGNSTRAVATWVGCSSGSGRRTDGRNRRIVSPVEPRERERERNSILSGVENGGIVFPVSRGRVCVGWEAPANSSYFPFTLQLVALGDAARPILRSYSLKRRRRNGRSSSLSPSGGHRRNRGSSSAQTAASTLLVFSLKIWVRFPFSRRAFSTLSQLFPLPLRLTLSIHSDYFGLKWATFHIL